MEEASNKAQHEEQLRKTEALKYHKEIDRLKALLAEQPAQIEKAVSARTRELQAEKDNLTTQINMLKGMVRSREVEKKARTSDVVKLERKLEREKEKAGSSPPPPIEPQRRKQANVSPKPFK